MDACTLCSLSKTRKNIVVGRGDPKASVWFIGEAPGEHEDESGFPFVGASGQELNKALEFLGLGQGKYYVTNVVRCRPVENGRNRAPTDEEKAICGEKLKDDIARWHPALLVTLGKHSTTYLLGDIGNMYSNVGKTYEYEGIKVFVTLHPAAILYRVGLRVMWERALGELKEVLP